MVKVALDVSFQDSQRFPHASLVGSPGLGKSVLANVIASELCVPFKEVLGQTLRTPADLNALLLGATEKSIVFVDESDTLPIPIQTALYLALDKKMLFLSSGGSVQSLPLADFTLLLATTEEYGMLQPLRDRCRLTLRFQFSGCSANSRIWFDQIALTSTTGSGTSSNVTFIPYYVHIPGGSFFYVLKLTSFFLQV